MGEVDRQRERGDAGGTDTTIEIKERRKKSSKG